MAASLCVRDGRVLSWIIRTSQDTVLGPLVTPQTRGPGPADGDGLAAGRVEYEDGPRFFEQFGGRLSPTALQGQRILDLGCGYGGRTVFYARKCAAAEVIGIEPYPSLVDRCRELAASLDCGRATFRLGVAESLPFDDGEFDMILSFDVLEHVESPAAALSEIRRVLRPGGQAWLVFPTYRGARASHLDFITRVPGLHRIFDPSTIVAVVNRELAADQRFGVRELPPPRITCLGHLALPTLNGMTRRDARDLIKAVGFTVAREHNNPFVRGSDPIPGAGPANALLRAWSRVRPLPEFLVGNLAYTLVR